MIALIIGSVFGFLLLIALIIFILRLFSITFFNLPGVSGIFNFIITILPYLVFFAGYYYMNRKASAAKAIASRWIGRFLLVIGSASCLLALVLSVLLFFGVKNDRMLLYSENTHYGWIVQIILLMFTALAIATGDPKEKNWMEKHKQ